MNKIVREHYPAANLPEDLREGLKDGATVRVVVEVETDRSAEGAPCIVMTDTSNDEQKPLTITETQALIARIRAQDRPSVSADQAVARIRELRDEWDY